MAAFRWDRCAARAALGFMTAAVLLAGARAPGAPSSLEGPRYIAFASDRPGGAGGWDIYLYDRVDQHLVPLPGLNGETTDIHPSLSAGAALVAFTSGRHPSKSINGGIFVYDRAAARVEEPPGANDETFSGAPSLTADGNGFSFTHFLKESEQKGGPRYSEVLTYDRTLGKRSTPETLNKPTDQHQLSSMSADGRLLAYQDSGYPVPDTQTIRVYDLRKQRDLGVLRFPDAVGPGDTTYPNLSGTGRYLSFSGHPKERPKDADVFVYDREHERLLDTPGLNSPEREVASSLSADGRFLVYDSMRSGSMDVMLYDLKLKRPVELPGLNSPSKDRFPALSRE